MKGLGADARYWQAFDEGRLELPRCSGCGRWHWPAPFRCGDCGSWDLDWHAVEMRGAIYSWTRTWHPFAGTEALGHPFTTISVELPQSGSIRLFGLLEAGDAAIGLPVHGTVKPSHVLGRDVPAIHWSVAA